MQIGKKIVAEAACSFASYALNGELIYSSLAKDTLEYS